MADLRTRILDARRPVSPPPGTPDLGAGIAPEGNTSFVLSSTNADKPESPGRRTSLAWSDDLLRDTADRYERVVMAVRDAARCAERRGLDPCRDPIYVSRAIREGWRLSSDQLSKILKTLSEEGHIAFRDRKKGRPARFVLRRSGGRPPEAA